MVSTQRRRTRLLPALAAALILGLASPTAPALAAAPVDDPGLLGASTSVAAERLLATEPLADSVDANADFPATPAGDHLRWVFAALNSADPIATADVFARFDPGMIEALGGTDALIQVFTETRVLAPFSVDVVQEDAGYIGALTTTSAGRFALTLMLSDAGLINGLTLQPYEEQPPAPADWEELDARVAALGVPARLSVVDISGQDPEMLHTTGSATGALPSASMFKLFVLQSVVEQIERGRLSWDDELAVTDAVRSLPSGTFQNEPDGTTFTVKESAQAMISVSDNTATDMLIAAIGGTATVEKTMKRLGIDKKQNFPMLTTRQFFQIGWGDAALRARWAHSSPGQRKQIVRAVDRGPLTTTGRDVTVPVWQDGVDWFFTDADLATVHASLRVSADTEAGAPLTEILGANPGIAFAEGWDRVQFKGGSSIGVLGGSWLLEHGDERYVVVLQIATEDLAVMPSTQKLVFLASDASSLLW